MHEEHPTNGCTEMRATNGNFINTESLNNQADLSVNESSPDMPKLSRLNRDIVRLIGQHLISVGLTKSADILMRESGCRLDHPVAARFRQHIMDANWGKAENDLEDLKSLLINPSNAITEMKFLILEQKYLEFLEDNRLYEALHVLRSELTPLNHDTNRVHQLSSYIMCSDTQELFKRANWEGKGEKSRNTLMEKLQRFLPATAMLPPRRLLTLLDQALEFQTNQCLYHNMKGDTTLENTSLLVDHMCSKDTFPNKCVQVLNEHIDEIWFCQFSPDGTKLATGSKDTNVIIWDVNPDTCTISIRRTLEGHTYGAAILCWNPDSIHLLVCGPEDSQEVWLWNTETDKLLKISQSSDDVLTTCAWNKEGSKFVAGGNRGHFYQCDMDGNVLDSWEGVRINWLQYRKDSKDILAADTHNRIRSYNFDELSDFHILKEDHSILSFIVNKSDTFAALNVMTQGIHLYDINDRTLVRKFRGLTQNTFRIHSCFGGLNHEYIASGSEDNKIYIWHINREKPLNVLEGHSRAVNCVDWNPVHIHMLASVSDDTTVRIWGPNKYAEMIPDGISSSKANSDSNNGNTWDEMVT